MSDFHRLAGRVFNVAVAIHPAKAEVIVATLAQRFGVTNIVIDGRAARMDAYELSGEDGDADVVCDPGYDVVAGIAVIPIDGTLVQKSSYMRPTSGMTGYNKIKQALMGALDDDAVQAIVLDVDSPGGECAGCFDLADTIFRARGKKPIWSILTENAYSAGYALASSADRVIVPRTGGTGSIGIICMHVDISGWLKQGGLNVTLIQYGARKADGAEVRPLTSEALQRVQADINTLGGIFDATVARNRKLKPERVKSYQAGTFMGQAGLAAGLADAVMAPDEAFRALFNTL